MVPPAAPNDLKTELAVLTQTGQAAKPAVHLSWEASEPGTYMIRGYRVFRQADEEAAETLRLGSNPPLDGLAADDTAEIGKSYRYRVEAIDVKGNTSSASQPAAADLVHLDASLLAPRSPRNLTATSLRSSVLLKWEAPEAWLLPISAYKLYRARSGPMEALPGFLTLTAFEDLSAPAGVPSVYAVTALDQKGLESAQSLTISGKATGTLAPSTPIKLTATVKPEKVSLAWEKSQAGTAPVTSYILRRIAEPVAGEKSESTRKFKPLEGSDISYSDSVEGERTYRYELRAVDTEGNSSEAATVRVFVPGKPFNKTQLLLMPTAYSNDPKHDSGLNVNVLFDIWLGSLYESYTSPVTGQPKSAFFQPLASSGQLASATLDLKYSPFEETWLSPALGLGFYGSALVPFGGQGGGQSVAVSSSGGQGFATLGNIYGVASKRFSRQGAVHFGLMLGKIADTLSEVLPKDWEPTVRHLTPSGDFPSLMARFVDPKLGASIQSAPHLVYGGIQFPMTVPLLFTNWKTALKLEVLRPVFPEYPSSYSQDQRQAADSQIPFMWNFHLDNLPLFYFEFSIFQYQGGFQWLAFIHTPDLTWSF
jgi:fibronectin type 3 domain-containing protein